MKKLLSLPLIIGLLILAAPQAKAQYLAVVDFYNEYQDYEDVHRIELDDDIFKLISWISSWDETDKEAAAVSRITENLEGITIIVVPKQYGPEKNILRLKKELKYDDFEELISIREEGKLLDFYSQGSQDEIRDMVIIVDEVNEYVIMSLKGSLSMEDMRYLANNHEEINH